MYEYLYGERYNTLFISLLLFRFFPIFVIIMGIASPATCGAVTSAAIAFVYRASSLPMTCLHAMLWGTGQTVATICISFTRVLATL